MSQRALTLVMMAWVLPVCAPLSAVEPTVPDSRPEPAVASSPEIEALLVPIREKHKVPGLVAGIVHGDRLTAAGATGFRKLGSPEPITLADELHIGSDTKAMTATQLALLVDQSKLSWQTTIGEFFPDRKADLHADFQAVTLAQLLTHRAGLPANGPWESLGNGPLVEQRELLLKKVLGKPPVHPPGTKFLYSNVGYVVAGHIAEQVTGKAWEELMTSGLFEPLQMKSAGFGPPGTKNQVDQPWGHRSLFGVVQPLQADNPPVMGPAGTVHCSLPDWARFVALHLQGARGEGKLLKPATFRALQQPAAGQEYAFGWGIVEQPWTKGPALTHSGSNTFWYATVWIAPARNAAYLAAANQGGEAGQLACNAAIVALIGNDEKSAPRAATAENQNKSADKAMVEIQKTSGGVRFGVLGHKPAAPAPTLFVFAHELAGTLTEADYNKVGMLLRKEGVLCVALDLPCHGQDVRPDEPAGLDGWAVRLRKDEDPVGAFTKQVSAVLDHLIVEGYSDREKVAVCGTSRGGFMAVHFAAAEPRVRCVATFAPVTELSALREFNGMEKHSGTTALDLRRQADKLAGRPIWMCIGNLDERVDTDRAIAFSRAAVKASSEAKKPPLVELHVMTSLGHTIHPTAHDEAAAWIAAQLK